MNNLQPVLEKLRVLSNEEWIEMKEILFDFIRRVSSKTEDKSPAEVAILPEMTKLFFDELLG